MLDAVPQEYKIVGPLHVGGRKPGDVVTRELVPDCEHLVRIGWLVPVESGTASSTMETPKKSLKEKS